MNDSNTDPRNSIHRSPLRETYLLIAGLLGGFGLFIVLALGVFSGAQATNATPPPDPALTGHFGRMFHLPPFAPPTMRFATLLCSWVVRAGLWMRTTIWQQALWR